MLYYPYHPIINLSYKINDIFKLKLIIKIVGDKFLTEKTVGIQEDVQ